jgi:undecaprenyl-diphosphatase
MSLRSITALFLLAFALFSTATKLNVLQRFDRAAQAWIEQQVTPSQTAWMLAVTQVGSTAGVLVITAVLAGLLALRKSHYWLGRLGLTVPVAMLLNEVLKYLFHRPRPAVAHPLVKLETYSYPSGHVVSAIVLYGFVAIFLSSYMTSRFWRIVIGAAAVGVVLLVGYSRIYLGVHYPTDVLGGMIEGVAWLSIAGLVTARHRPLTA